MKKNNIKIIKDEKYNFVSYFNLDNGDYIRFETEEVFRASFPHLLDIGIMGHCLRGLSGNCKIDCYQSGKLIEEPNMELEDYKKIIRQSKDKVFQVALGGRGDPDTHENFEEILSFTRENEIIPNLTTSGFFLNEGTAKIIKKYCGACAVSFYEDEYSDKALELLLEQEVITNIHFVLSNKTIDRAIKLLENIKDYEKINRIIFLLYKPIGQGKDENVLSVYDERLMRLIQLMEENLEKVGFDSCLVPAIVNFAKRIDKMCYDACEAGRFSAYISPSLKISPCSFEKTGQFDVDLKNLTIQEAWNSKVFSNFLSSFETSCPECKNWPNCMGGCPISSRITLCTERGTSIEI